MCLTINMPLLLSRGKARRWAGTLMSEAHASSFRPPTHLRAAFSYLAATSVTSHSIPKKATYPWLALALVVLHDQGFQLVNGPLEEVYAHHFALQAYKMVKIVIPPHMHTHKQGFRTEYAAKRLSLSNIT